MLKWIGWKYQQQGASIDFTRKRIIRFFSFTKKTFFEHSLTHKRFELCMLMEIVCFSEWVRERTGILDLAYINPFCTRLYTRSMSLKSNMEKVLPANYSIVVSCEPNSSLDYQQDQQRPTSPRSHRGKEFCYHINSICRRHRIYKVTFIKFDPIS